MKVRSGAENLTFALNGPRGFVFQLTGFITTFTGLATENF